MAKYSLKSLLKEARKAGWSISPTGSGHIKLVPPGGGPPVFSSSTPRNEWRTCKNLRAEMNRALAASSGTKVARYG